MNLAAPLTVLLLGSWPTPIVPAEYADFRDRPVLISAEVADVRQGRLGDCWLLAAVASMVDADPGWAAEYVETLDEDAWLPSLDGGASTAYAQLSGDAETWVALIEKHFAARQDGYMALSGGMPAYAYQVLGYQAQLEWGAHQLQGLTWPNLAVSAGTRSDATYLPGNHAVAVLDVEPLTVYDPLTRRVSVGEHLLSDITLINWTAMWTPGDADGDGFVGDRDYTLWADHYGLTGASWRDGDWTGDGWVSDADYTIWADRYDPAVVPETLHIWGLGLCMVALLKRGGSW